MTPVLPCPPQTLRTEFVGSGSGWGTEGAGAGWGGSAQALDVSPASLFSCPLHTDVSLLRPGAFVPDSVWPSVTVAQRPQDRDSRAPPSAQDPSPGLGCCPLPQALFLGEWPQFCQGRWRCPRWACQPLSPRPRGGLRCPGVLGSRHPPPEHEMLLTFI